MNSMIQEKLSQYEAPPPPGMWDRIDAALDEADGGDYAQKLYHFEAEPPAGAWEAISQKLSARTPAPVVPFFRRYRMPLKYSGVAASIFFFGVLTTLLISKRSESETPVKNAPLAGKSSTHKTITVPKVIPPPNATTLPVRPSPDNMVAANDISPVYQKRDRPVRITMPRPATGLTSIGMMSYLPAANPFPFSGSALPPGKYMVLSNGDGQALRLSTKIFDAFACGAEDLPCREKLKTLQSRLASSALSTDFSGLLEMLKNLQENQ